MRVTIHRARPRIEALLPAIEIAARVFFGEELPFARDALHFTSFVAFLRLCIPRELNAPKQISSNTREPVQRHREINGHPTTGFVPRQIPSARDLPAPCDFPSDQQALHHALSSAVCCLPTKRRQVASVVKASVTTLRKFVVLIADHKYRIHRCVFALQFRFWMFALFPPRPVERVLLF